MIGKTVTNNQWLTRTIFETKDINDTLKVSTKNILTVESRSAAATNFPFGDNRTHRTVSSNFKVLVCNSDNTLALLSLFSSAISSNCQNFTVLSPPPVTQPL